MRIRNIIRRKFKVFGKLPEKERNEQKELIEYINFVSSSRGVDISNLNIFKIFGDVTVPEKKIITDRGEINKILLEMHDSLPKTITLDAAVKGQIDALTKDRVESKIREHHKNHEKFLISANKCHADYVQELVLATQEYQNIMDLEKRESGISESILKVLENKFWEYHALRDKKIYFKTAGNVIINKQNPTAGIDIKVDLGYLVAELDMQDMQLRVLPYKDNLHFAKYYHPHVNDNGGICWGNISETVGEALSEGDIEKAMTLLASLLITYCGDNPHIPIERLQSKGVKPKPGTLNVQPILSDVEIQEQVEKEEEEHDKWLLEQADVLGLPEEDYSDQAYGGNLGEAIVSDQVVIDPIQSVDISVGDVAATDLFE